MPIFTRSRFSTAIFTEVRLYGGHVEKCRKNTLDPKLLLKTFGTFCLPIFNRVEASFFSAPILNSLWFWFDLFWTQTINHYCPLWHSFKHLLPICNSYGDRRRWNMCGDHLVSLIFEHFSLRVKIAQQRVPCKIT